MKGVNHTMVSAMVRASYANFGMQEILFILFFYSSKTHWRFPAHLLAIPSPNSTTLF